jgi:DNA (cytosine-5)-methyltransferase 1
MGYHMAGFDVTGVDVVPQPNYPFAFIEADATTFPLGDFQVIHASPPCQAHSALAKTFGLGYSEETSWMLQHTIDRLRDNGAPFVIENVPGAVMPNAFLMCGRAMGLGALRRHRLFMCEPYLIMSPGCGCDGRPTVGVYGELRQNDRPARKGQRVMRASRDTARQLMVCHWMSGPELSQAIPPIYTHHIGEQLMEHIR